MVDSTVSPTEAGTPALPARRTVFRHALIVRITHWINVACITFLLMSGLQIFNAHPSLYWGDTATFDADNQPVDTVVSLRAFQGPEGLTGQTQIFGLTFDTTGFLGASEYQGQDRPRGFPSWLTLPSYQDLATGRLWHFLFAWIFVINGALYLLYGLFGRHIRRDLIPSRSQWRHIGGTILHHLSLRFPRGEEATTYNILQKLAYLGAILSLIVIVITGLSMSPGLNSALPWLPEILGGRQSARTIHFFAASAVVIFTIIHVVMVLISGVWNNIASMITGRYAVAKQPWERSASVLIGIPVTAALLVLILEWWVKLPALEFWFGPEPLIIPAGALVGIALFIILSTLAFIRRSQRRRQGGVA